MGREQRKECCRCDCKVQGRGKLGGKEKRTDLRDSDKAGEKLTSTAPGERKPEERRKAGGKECKKDRLVFSALKSLMHLIGFDAYLEMWDIAIFGIPTFDISVPGGYWKGGITLLLAMRCQQR